jgi:hypothetical protein
MIRFILCFTAILFCLEANAAGCQNGRCSTVRTVRTGTVQTVKNVSKGAIRVVTPPYRTGRCVNGKCNLR